MTAEHRATLAEKRREEMQAAAQLAAEYREHQTPELKTAFRAAMINTGAFTILQADKIIREIARA